MLENRSFNNVFGKFPGVETTGVGVELGRGQERSAGVVVDDRSVVVRTAAYSAMAREVDESQVAFELERARPDFRELLARAELSVSQCGYNTTVDVLRTSGAVVGSSDVVVDPPVDALIEKVKEVDGREAIILTRPHLVAEFFHVDWTSRARRKLGVPVLHLLEHENFDEQAGGGEGVYGF